MHYDSEGIFHYDDVDGLLEYCSRVTGRSIDVVRRVLTARCEHNWACGRPVVGLLPYDFDATRARELHPDLFRDSDASNGVTCEEEARHAVRVTGRSVTTVGSVILAEREWAEENGWLDPGTVQTYREWVVDWFKYIGPEGQEDGALPL